MKKDTKVSIVIGSESDKETILECTKILDEKGVGYELKVLSAHRNPEQVREYAKELASRGVRVVIAGAGKSAALSGVVASYTTLPVIGVPMKTSDLGGMDSLLSTVQMPSGVPVACMGIGIAGAKNAAHLAVRILALEEKDLIDK